MQVETALLLVLEQKYLNADNPNKKRLADTGGRLPTLVDKPTELSQHMEFVSKYLTHWLLQGTIIGA